MKPESDEAGVVRLAGTTSAGPNATWKIVVLLDRKRDLLPTDVDAHLSHSGGEIRWAMKVRRAVDVSATHAIADAIITLYNSSVNDNYWTVYHFELRGIEKLPSLTKESLELEIPRTGVNILDEVSLYSRIVDGSGKVVENVHWTKEERDADLRGIREAELLRGESLALVLARRRMFLAIVAIALVVSVGVVGTWLWKRRHSRSL